MAEPEEAQPAKAGRPREHQAADLLGHRTEVVAGRNVVRPIHAAGQVAGSIGHFDGVLDAMPLRLDFGIGIPQFRQVRRPRIGVQVSQQPVVQRRILPLA